MHTVEPVCYIQVRNWENVLKSIEEKGRLCYKSEEKMTINSSEGFVRGLIKSGHLSVLEHETISIRFVVDRGIGHEIVRHRQASFSQESTRYCNYGNTNGGCSFIAPFFYKDNFIKYSMWEAACALSEDYYNRLLGMGSSAQEARTVLNNSLKTEIWVTANLREWLDVILDQRTSKKAHPQMRQTMIPVLLYLQQVLSAVFGHIEYDKDFPAEHYAGIVLI